MMTMTQGISSKRVLCLLDSTAESRTSLDFVACLAAEMGGEVVALYVEEPELLDAANLSVAQLITVGRRREPLDKNLLRRAMAVSAHRAESQLAEAGKRWHVQTTFRRVTTLTQEVVIAEAEQCHLIALSQSRMRALSPTAEWSRGLLSSKTRCSVLLSRREPSAHRPLAVVVELDDKADDQILRQALALAAAHQLPLRVYVSVSDGDKTQDQVAVLRERLSRNTSVAGIIPLAGRDAANLEGALSREPASILLLSRHGIVGRNIDPSDLLSKKLAATVLLTA